MIACVIIVALLFMVCASNKNRWVKAATGGIAIGMIAFVPGIWFFTGMCEAKKLPWSFCGDLTGVIQIALSGILVGIVACLIAGFTIYRRNK